MAESRPCDGCGTEISLIFAAQFRHKEHSAILCQDCYRLGFRCWVVSDKIIVTTEQPDQSERAELYWDEGFFVTEGNEE